MAAPNPSRHPLRAVGATLRRSGVSLLPPVASVIVLVLLWEGAVRLFNIPLYFIPPPSAVGATILERSASLSMHTWTTTYETVIAFLASIALGVPLGIAIVSWRFVDRTAYPILVASQAIPKVAIAPLLTIWLGYGLAPKIVVGLIIAFFPVVISTVVGLRSVPIESIHLGRSMGLGRLGMFVRISLPYALPSIMGGLKVAIALAVVGAVVGEFTGADRGLGYLLQLSVGQLDTRLTFAAMMLLVALGVVLFGIVAWLERLATPWHSSQRLADVYGGTA
jgi:NitT/TauT family transport system permease protein